MPSCVPGRWSWKTEAKFPTRVLKNKLMEFLFSNFLGALADSSPPWAASEEGLISTEASAVLVAALGSSLALVFGAASAAAGGAAVSFLGSAAWMCRQTKWEPYRQNVTAIGATYKGDKLLGTQTSGTSG